MPNHGKLWKSLMRAWLGDAERARRKAAACACATILPIRQPIMKLLTTLILALAAGSASLAEEKLPNIVIIFMDDMGYADVGCFGAQGYRTPNIDSLAAEGRKFTNFHVSQAVCSASRAALMTGCY